MQLVADIGPHRARMHEAERREDLDEGKARHLDPAVRVGREPGIERHVIAAPVEPETAGLRAAERKWVTDVLNRVLAHEVERVPQ